MMVVECDSPREMSEGERLVDGDGGCGPPACAEDDSDGGPGGGEGVKGGCGDDDEIFLLPLTALAMEADDLRWDLSDTAISALKTIKTCRE